MYKYVCHVTVYFNKELHRIHRKTCLMDLSIGLRLPVLDINQLLLTFMFDRLNSLWRGLSVVKCLLTRERRCGPRSFLHCGCKEG